MAKITFLPALAALAIGATVASQPAAAQVAGIASADPTLAIAQTKAFAAASQQINTTYKSQFDQMTARDAAFKTQIQPLIPQIDTNKDGRVSQDEFNAAQAAKSPAAAQWVAAQTAHDTDVDAMSAPILRAQAYAIESIINAYPAALKQVIADKKISVILTPESFVYAPDAVDVTADIAAAMDKTTPTVSIAAPASWAPQQQTLQIQQQIQRLIAIRAAQARAAGQGGAGGTPKPGDSR